MTMLFDNFESILMGKLQKLRVINRLLYGNSYGVLIHERFQDMNQEINFILKNYCNSSEKIIKN